MHPEFIGWLQYLGFPSPRLDPLTKSDPCRQWYRLYDDDGTTRIVLDASRCPEVIPRMINDFLRLQEVGVPVATLRSFELPKGFALIDDAGLTTLDDMTDDSKRSALYIEAVNSILTIQQAPIDKMEAWDKIGLMQSLHGVMENYLKGVCRVAMGCADTKVCLDAFEVIADALMRQPQGVFVHGCLSPSACKVQDDKVIVIRYGGARIGGALYDFATLCAQLRFEDHALYERLRMHFCQTRKLDLDTGIFEMGVAFSLMYDRLLRLSSYAKGVMNGIETQRLQPMMAKALEEFVAMAENHAELKAFKDYVSQPNLSLSCRC